MQIAKTMGLRTLNVVRRSHLVDHLRAFGGDGQVTLGIDAVAGEATRRLANCLADGGTVVNYGLLAGKPCEVDAADIIFRDISLKGFWYSRWLSTSDPTAVTSMFARLVGMLHAKTLRVPVEAVYPLDRLTDALVHAQREGRLDKVVLRWKGE